MDAPDTPDAPLHGRDMEEPYTGPLGGHGIAALGGVSQGGLRSAMEFAEMIVDTIREGLLVLDLDLNVQAANESFYEMCGATREEVEGRLVYEIQDGRWDDPALRTLLERILPERASFDDFRIEHEGVGGERRVLMLNARQLNHHQLILLAVEDVTERMRARDELERQVQARTHLVRMLAAKLSVAEQEERRRISRLLHDDLQQRIAGAAMMLAALPKQASSEARDEIAARVGRILAEAGDLTRTLVGDLSPEVLAQDRLADVLRWLAERKGALLGLEVTVEGDAVVTDLTVRTLVLQLTRELLFNVAKHAGTRQARITVADAGDEVAVHVEDDGAGLDPAALGRGTGQGLTGIGERLEIVGGRYEVAPGEGTRVGLFLPKRLGIAT